MTDAFTETMINASALAGRTREDYTPPPLIVPGEPRMTEKELETKVKRLVQGYGLYGYHTHDSRRSEPGWPDWVVVGRAVIYRELKAPYGSLSPAQRRVGYMLQAAGADWGIWRPEDLASGRITRELEALL